MEAVSGTAETDGQCQAVTEPPRSQDISCLGELQAPSEQERVWGEGLVPLESGSGSSQWMRSCNKSAMGFGQTYGIM